MTMKHIATAIWSIATLVQATAAGLALGNSLFSIAIGCGLLTAGSLVVLHYIQRLKNETRPTENKQSVG